jgi:5'(3')-deoxyribonucleotidase
MPKLRKPVVLLDCDGVLSNYANGVVEFINDKTGSNLTVNDVKTWKIFDAIGGPTLEKKFYDRVAEGGFCSSLEPFIDAVPAIDELRGMSEVYVVTSPMWLPVWIPERTEWLYRKFGISRNRIVYTSAKHLVGGDIFVDDSLDNVKRWKKSHDDSIAILWDAPYNKSDDEKQCGALRLSNWDDVISLVDSINYDIKAGR